MRGACPARSAAKRSSANGTQVDAESEPNAASVMRFASRYSSRSATRRATTPVSRCGGASASTIVVACGSEPSRSSGTSPRASSRSIRSEGVADEPIHHIASRWPRSVMAARTSASTSGTSSGSSRRRETDVKVVTGPKSRQ